MINIKKLDELYERIVIYGVNITTSNLKELGFNSHDIAKLHAKNSIKRIKRGIYLFIDYEELINYGKRLINDKQYDNALFCFERLYRMNFSNLKAISYLFYLNIKIGDYDSALNYLKYLKRDKNINFILYLLNFITDLPEDLKLIVKNMNEEDILEEAKEQSSPQVSLHNEIKKLALKKHFRACLNKFRKPREIPITELDKFYYSIIKEASKKYNVENENILDLVTNERYDEALIYYEDISRKTGLTNIELVISELLRDLNEYKMTKRLTYSRGSNSDFSSSIIEKDYERALFLNEQKALDLKGNKFYEIITILLTKLVQAIKEEEYQVIYNNLNLSNDTIKDIIFFLKTGEISKALDSIHSYLLSKSLEKYEFIVIKLIKISLITHDNEFLDVLDILCNLNSYQYNPVIYIQEFYRCLKEENIEVANLYLDIIKEAQNIGESSNLLPTMEEELQSLSRKKATY